MKTTHLSIRVLGWSWQKMRSQGIDRVAILSAYIQACVVVSCLAIWVHIIVEIYHYEMKSQSYKIL